MARPALPREPFEFVMLEDRGLDEDDNTRTVWDLRPLGRREQRESDNLVTVDPDTGDVAPRIGDIREGALRVGLKGCRNFYDVDVDGTETEIVFERTKEKQVWLGIRLRPPTDEFLDRLTKSQEIELSDAIINNSRMSAAAGKD